MLEDHVRPIPRNALLSDEERQRMSEENRRAAELARGDVIREDSTEACAEEAEELVEAEEEYTGYRSRSAAPANGSGYGAGSGIGRRRERTRRARTAEAVGAYEADAARKTASDRRRMSEHNRREAGRILAELPQPPHEKRHVVPTHEELIRELRAAREAERGRQEAERLRRMQQSAENLRESGGADSVSGVQSTVPAALYGGSAALTQGSSAVAIEESEPLQRAPAEVREDEVLPEPESHEAEQTAPQRHAKHAVWDGRDSVSRRSAFYPKRMNTVRTVILGAVAVALIGMVIYGKVQANELYTDVRRLQAQYDDIVAQNVSMRSEMEGKMTVKNIEEYAENVLGLKQLDQSQIQYIQIQTEDEVTITEPETNWLVTVNDFLTDIWNFFRGE